MVITVPITIIGARGDDRGMTVVMAVVVVRRGVGVVEVVGVGRNMSRVCKLSGEDNDEIVDTIHQYHRTVGRRRRHCCYSLDIRHARQRIMIIMRRRILPRRFATKDVWSSPTRPSSFIFSTRTSAFDDRRRRPPSASVAATAGCADANRDCYHHEDPRRIALAAFSSSAGGNDGGRADYGIADDAGNRPKSDEIGVDDVANVKNSNAGTRGGGGGADDHDDDHATTVVVEDYHYNGMPITGRQRNLLHYTRSILHHHPPPVENNNGDVDSGMNGASSSSSSSLSQTQIMRIVNMIDTWLSTTGQQQEQQQQQQQQHGQLGADQAFILIQRLIKEHGRGGGSGYYQHQNPQNNNNTTTTTNIDVITWDMYRLRPYIQYIDTLYVGIEFITRILDIVVTFEREYITTRTNNAVTTANNCINDGIISSDDGGSTRSRNNSREEEVVVVVEEEGEEVPYKSIIAILCDLRSLNGAAAAELILDRFESRILSSTTTTRAGRGEDRGDENDASREEFAAAVKGCYYHSNPPTIETYNNVMSSWSKCGCDSGSYNDFLLSLSSSSSSLLSSSSTTTTWPHVYHPNPCSNLLRHMLIVYHSNPSRMQRIKPDFLTFNIAISSLSNDPIYRQRMDGGGGGGGGRKVIDHVGGGVGKACYDHIMSMLELYYEDNGTDVRCAPDIITFSTVLNVLGRGSSSSSSSSSGQDVDVDGDEERAREILDIMLYLSGISDDKGNAILAGGKHDDGKFAKFAYPHGTKYEFDVRPRNKHFNVVLALMANKRHVTDETLEHAMKYVNIMELLRRDEMMDGGLASDDLPQRHSDNVYIDVDDDSAHYDNHRHVDPRWNGSRMVSMTMMRSAPDIVTYNTLLNIAARANRPEKAEELLNGMINGTSSHGVRPDNISFNTVLLAWSKAKSDKGRLKTEQILDKMHRFAMEGDANVRPDRTSMTTVINAIISTVQRNSMAPIQAERIIELMESNKDDALRPDVVTYTSLIKCWSESGKLRAPDRAEEIINTLHERYDIGYHECKPDTMAYNVAINAIAKSGVTNAPERAEALLNRMLDSYYAGDTDLTPTTQSFSTTILAWARLNDRRGALKAEELLQTMHDLEDAEVGNVSPNTICYSTCILAWKNSGQPDAGERANALLEKMESFDKKGLYNLKPNVVAFTNAMEAWIISRQPESLDMVEAIVERMINRAMSGDIDSAPTTTTFNVAIKAIRHSTYPAKHEKANEMLNRMKWMQENGVGRVRPNIYTYNAVSRNLPLFGLCDPLYYSILTT